MIGQIANTGGAAVTVKANSTVSFTAKHRCKWQLHFEPGAGNLYGDATTDKRTNFFYPDKPVRYRAAEHEPGRFHGPGIIELVHVIRDRSANLRVPITMTAASGGNSHITSTGTNGNYSFAQACRPRPYIVTAKRRFQSASYSPQSQSISLVSNTNIQTFITTASRLFHLWAGHAPGRTAPSAYQNIYVIATGTNVFNASSSIPCNPTQVAITAWQIFLQPVTMSRPSRPYFSAGSRAGFRCPGDIATGINFNLPDTNNVSLMLSNSGNNSCANIFFNKWVPKFPLSHPGLDEPAKLAGRFH